MFTRFLSALLVCGLFLAVAPASAQQKEYIGAAKCKICHNKPPQGEQFNKWSASKHSKAMQSLKGDEAKNPKCLKCHSTAAGLVLSDTQTITVAEGVSCESCHGAGSAYKTPTIMKDQAKAIAAGMIIPDENLCKKCHNAESPNFKGFEYKTAFAKIAHPNPAKVK
ncbi:MAG: multiheme c-type cytochrome [Bacteroidia bacterium]|nr:multiheme c-type cytochrome [Bacteroidia bacterium]